VFNCKICGNSSAPGETQHKVVIATRTHQHKERDNAYPPRKNDRGEKVRRHDPGGHGTQIVHEVNACASCALKTKHDTPIHRLN